MRRLILSSTPPTDSGNIIFPMYIFSDEVIAEWGMTVAYSYGDYRALRKYLKDIIMENGEGSNDQYLDLLQYGIEIYVDYILIYDMRYNVEHDYIYASTNVFGASDNLVISDAEIHWDVYMIDNKYPESTFSYGFKESLADSVVYRSGMTWRSFCESEYNTGGFSIGEHPVTGEEVVIADTRSYLIKGYNIYSKPTDLIESIFYTCY